MNAPRCRRCGSFNVEQYEDYLGPDPNDMDGEAWGPAWTCHDCGHDWDPAREEDYEPDFESLRDRG